MLASILPLLKIQMIMGLFTGRRGGGFSIGKIMNMIMMFAMLPVLTKSLGGLSV